MSYRIDKVGIIGAGTMGGGIAAHLANIGIPVVLLDIVPPNLTEAEQKDPKARNRFVQGGYERMVKAKPANLGRADRADLITLGNTEDDLEKLADCDWVVEVIIEKLPPKQALMAQLEKIVKPTAIISSNTSGIPIHQITANCSDDFKSRFLGTHFFNPPRYLKLLEIIPTADTSPEVIKFMVDFGTKVLGKGVVVCKDTPNFIANRFIAVAGTYGAEVAMEMGLTVDEVDSISGPLVGRPKTATFRLTDLVGLDIMYYVNENLYPAIAHDNYREYLKAPLSSALYQKMMDSKWLGNKTGQGFYKQVNVNGERQFWSLNLQTLEYEAPQKIRFESVGAVRKIENLGERLKKLFSFEDKAAAYLRKNVYFNLVYAAYVGPEIAHKLSDIDNAVRWGFAHEAGPFEIWDMLGVAETIQKMEAAGFDVPDWVKDMVAEGHTSFYNEKGECYDFVNGGYLAGSAESDIITIDYLRRKNGKPVAQNMSAALHDMGDGVLLYEFNAKMNAIDDDIVAMGYKGLELLEAGKFDAMVMGNNGQDFCVGANIFAVMMGAMQGEFGQLEQVIYRLQKLTFDLHYASKPVVTAPHQRVLGGGVEMALAGWASVADHETYMGLVEVGVGLIPAGGGCMELLRRRVNPVMRTENADVLPVLQDVFTQIATAQVGTSAWEARKLGYLRDTDTINMNSDRRLLVAKQKALELAASGIRPEPEKIYAAGRDVQTALKLGIKGFVWGNYATEHDGVISRKLANVLCGGNLSAPTWVDPWYILDLEREAFLSLLGEQKTLDRIQFMLQNGKPLRN